MRIVALGDSVVNAELSWAYWLALAAGRTLHKVSVDGSLSGDVVRDQLPRLGRDHYDVACVTVGTNDILFDWDRHVFAANLAVIVAAAAASAERVVVQTVCSGLASFPGSASQFRRGAREANAIIRQCGALVLASEDLHGARHLLADRIHPSLAGQLALADRAAALLHVAPAPSSLCDRTLDLHRSTYYRVAAHEVPRRIVLRLLGRPIYRRT